MRTDHTSLQQLARDARDGDESAAMRLANELHPQVTRMIRRMVRGRGAPLPSALRAVEEAIHLVTRETTALEDEGTIIAEVARRVCRAALERLCSEHINQRQCLETVVA